jgi:hypothetical protein
MRTASKILTAGLTAITLSACSGTPVHFNDVTAADQIDLTRGEHLSSSASGFQFMLLIPIAINGRQNRALEEIREQAGDRALTNIKISESWRYAFVGTVYTTTIDATAYPRINAASVAKP